MSETIRVQGRRADICGNEEDGWFIRDLASFAELYRDGIWREEDGYGTDRWPTEAAAREFAKRHADETCPTCKGDGRIQEGTGHASSEGGEDWREVPCPDCEPRDQSGEPITVSHPLGGRIPVIAKPDQHGWCCINAADDDEVHLTVNGNWACPPAPMDDLFFYGPPEKAKAFIAMLTKHWHPAPASEPAELQSCQTCDALRNRLYGNRELWVDKLDDDSRRRAQQEADEHGVRVDVVMHGQTVHSARPSELAAGCLQCSQRHVRTTLNH